jgi:hypothetical protein
MLAIPIGKGKREEQKNVVKLKDIMEWGGFNSITYCNYFFFNNHHILQSD